MICSCDIIYSRYVLIDTLQWNWLETRNQQKEPLLPGLFELWMHKQTCEQASKTEMRRLSIASGDLVEALKYNFDDCNRRVKQMPG